MNTAERIAVYAAEIAATAPPVSELTSEQRTRLRAIFSAGQPRKRAA